MVHQKEVLEHGIQTYNVNGQKKWKWKVSMSTIDKKNVIQFPLKATPNPNIKIDDYALQMQQDMVFADHLTEGLVVNMIHNMGENGIDTDDEEFIADISMMIEQVKSTIYRSCNIPHPMQDVVDAFVMTTSENGKISSYLDCRELRDVLVQDGEEEE